MSDATTEQKKPKPTLKHGDYLRQRLLKERGLDAIDRRTYAGRLVWEWYESALKAKGGAACPFHVKIEITLAAFDLWRLLCLLGFIVADANERQALINKRYRVLPSIHSQYNEIETRFARRVEALQLDKRAVGGLDLASMLKAQSDARNQGKD